MFTNWLTGTSGTNNHNNHNTNGNNQINLNLLPPNTPLENRAANLLTNPAGHILMSTPPDVVLEVGPAPSTVRFVAHSIVLGMHSGYLRSAIRLDEHVLADRNSASSSSSTGSPDFVLFLSNVTAEQFAPLLTYMYTGYLDLNIENIFGVLLATHVLHMPRALEICRAFLARAQTEGYLGARLAAGNANLQSSNHQTAATATTTNLSNTNNSNTNNNNNNKIIRPIPSKATAMPHFGFLPLPAAATEAPQQQQQEIMLANFKQLQRQRESLYQQTQQQQQQPNLMDSENTISQEIKQNERAKSEEIDVDQESSKAASELDDRSSDKAIIQVHNDDNDDEDEEVFIDSDSDDVDNDNDNDSDNDEMEVIIEVKQNTKSGHKQKQQPKLGKTAAAMIKTKEEKKPNPKHKSKEATKKPNNQQQTKRRTHHKSRSGLQIAKAPIPASQLDVNEGSKVIIDVASCDGPVRFRRILNTAYGHKPEDLAQQMPERSQQSVSYSFHQQMARTIHHQQQQRQQLQKQQHATGEESENSESSGGGGGGGAGGKQHNSKASSQLNSNEIYVCVYCKHTFKSQYCYQKHAKRHLNPLSLNPTERCDNKSTAAASAAAAVNLNFNASAQFNASAGGAGGASGGAGVGCLPLPPLLAAKQTANDLLRREVRPLDMNVQYYPCKTCGSKFPSYYFVHKHRKLCHADEELSAEKVKHAAAAANGTSDTSHSGSNLNEEISAKDQQQSSGNDLLDLKTTTPVTTGNSSSVSNSNSDSVEEHQVKHEH